MEMVALPHPAVIMLKIQFYEILENINRDDTCVHGRHRLIRLFIPEGRHDEEAHCICAPKGLRVSNYHG